MRFDVLDYIEPLGDGRYGVSIEPGWRVVVGPNGGYVAALFVGAIERHVEDPTRQLRSLTVHYLSVPDEGPAEIEVVTEKLGRSVHFVRATLRQGDTPRAVCLAASSTPRPGLTIRQWPAPDVPPPEASTPMIAVREGSPLPIHQRYDIRLAAGGPLFAEVADAELIWWIRPEEPQPLSAPLIAALTDALPPPIFATSSEPLAVPTVDLSIHVRAQLQALDWHPDDWVLARFRTRWADGGFLEEDGALWLRDGTLLAHSRQLALSV